MLNEYKEQNKGSFIPNEPQIEDDCNEVMNDTYEKRDRLSHYKKMNIKTSYENSNIEENSGTKTKPGSPSHQNNMKISKAGIPLGPGKNP